MMAVESRFAVAGRKGGKKRMASLSDEDRSELGKLAAAVRWNDGRPEAHQVVKQMLLAIANTGTDHRLYVRGKTVWHAPVEHLEESRWMDWCVGTYSGDATFSSVIEDIMAI